MRDASVTKDLIQTLEDGKDGFDKAADKLDESDAAELSSDFRKFSAQRAQFSDELQQLAATYGDDIEESGSAAAAAHRGWLSLKDALSGSSPNAVIDAALQGDDHAVKAYEEAAKGDISPELRRVVQRQMADIKAARDQVKGMAERQS